MAEVKDELTAVRMAGDDDLLPIGGETETDRVSIKDVAGALFGNTPTVDPDENKLISQFEQQLGSPFPTDLKEISTWVGIEEAVCSAYPTNNHYLPPSQWNEIHMMSDDQEDFLVRIMDENQGCCYWFAAWKKGDKSCRVYVSKHTSPETAEKTSNSLCAFLYDYAQRGKAWYKSRETTTTVFRSTRRLSDGTTITVIGGGSQSAVDRMASASTEDLIAEFNAYADKLFCLLSLTTKAHDADFREDLDDAFIHFGSKAENKKIAVRKTQCVFPIDMLSPFAVNKEEFAAAVEAI